MDVSDIFYFFFLLGEGERESKAPGGRGDGSFIENPTIPRGGGVPGEEGAEGPGGYLGRTGEVWGGGGGLNIVFRGRNVHQVALQWILGFLLSRDTGLQVLPKSDMTCIV